MENNPILDSDFQSEAGLEVSREARSYLNEAGRWAQFLAILGFIGSGFLFLFGLFFMAMGSSPGVQDFMPYPSAFLGVTYLILGAIYIFPFLYLYRFATRTKEALHRGDTTQLTEGLGYLKSTFKFWGILSIIMIGISILGFLAAMIGGAMML